MDRRTLISLYAHAHNLNRRRVFRKPKMSGRRRVISKGGQKRFKSRPEWDVSV